VLPTPIEAVQAVAGISSRLDISKLSDLPDPPPRGLSKVLGAIVFDERVVFIDGDQPEVRVRFTDAHEAAHALCPWHEDTLRLIDTEQTLFKEMSDHIEAEANYGAARLIFQGDHLMRRALEEQYSIQVPLALAGDYGASSTATIRQYVREHPAAVGLLVTGRYARGDGLPIWYSEESQSFLSRFGRLPVLLPDGPAPLRAGTPLGDLIEASRTTSSTREGTIGLRARDGTDHLFAAETFFNQHTFFMMVTERSGRRLGHRLRPTPAPSPRAA
jgi:hypothetical protein